MERHDERGQQIAGKRNEGGRTDGRRGWLKGRWEERVRVWREDREMDRITGFKSRTERERWEKTKGEREREHSGLRGLERLTKSTQAGYCA